MNSKQVIKIVTVAVLCEVDPLLGASCMLSLILMSLQCIGAIPVFYRIERLGNLPQSLLRSRLQSCFDSMLSSSVSDETLTKAELKEPIHTS